MKTEEYKELDVLMSSEVINTKGEDNKFKLPSLPYKENALEPYISERPSNITTENILPLILPTSTI